MRACLRACVLACLRACVRACVHRVLAEEYLNLMRDPDSNNLQGDDFKTEADAAFGPMTISKDEVSVSEDDVESSSDGGSTQQEFPHCESTQ